jgi:hypothetical protein
MTIHSERNPRTPPIRPSSSPTRVLPPARRTEVDPYALLPEDPSEVPSREAVLSNGSLPAAVAVRGAAGHKPLTDSDLQYARRVEHRVKGDLREQREILKEAGDLYAQRPTAPIAPPAKSFFGRAVSWLAAKCGFSDGQTKADLAISRKLEEARTKTVEKLKVFVNGKDGTREANTSILEEAKKVSKRFEGRVFAVDKSAPKTSVPKILMDVSIPVDKEHLSFQKLKKQLLETAKASNGRIKLHSPSNERVVLYRQRKDKSWESVEISWRGLTKVNIVHNGKLAGNLFNCDAVELAKKFANFERIGIKRRESSQEDIRKVISLKDERR